MLEIKVVPSNFNLSNVPHRLLPRSVTFFNRPPNRSKRPSLKIEIPFRVNSSSKYSLLFKATEVQRFRGSLCPFDRRGRDPRLPDSACSSLIGLPIFFVTIMTSHLVVRSPGVLGPPSGCSLFSPDQSFFSYREGVRLIVAKS